MNRQHKYRKRMENPKKRGGGLDDNMSICISNGGNFCLLLRPAHEKIWVIPTAVIFVSYKCQFGFVNLPYICCANNLVKNNNKQKYKPGKK